MDFVIDSLNLLTKLENTLKCPICSEKCVEPVRIKTCGHYFCRNCLKSSKKDHNCPKCNEFYENKHLDYENVAKTCDNKFSELREILESVKTTNNNVPNKSQEDPSTAQNIPKSIRENTIFYDNTEYHVNFAQSVGKNNAKGETPLHLACKRNKLEEVKKLVEARVDINAKDYAGWAPLHEAVQSESLQIIEYLLQKNCLINIPGADYATPLHQAASLDNIDIVNLLLKYGANKNLVDYSGSKPEDCTKSGAVREVLIHHNAASVERKLFEVFLPAKVFLYCHSIDEHLKTKLVNCKNIQVVDKMDMKKHHLTHFLIKKSHKTSFKILQAMLEGLQFLTEDSIESYTKGNYFINISEYTFLSNDHELNNGIQKAMLSALLKLPKLFDGINFYIEDHASSVDVYHLKVDKDYLTKLIKAGGGKVLHRPPATRTCETEFAHPFFAPVGAGTYRCCHFILYDENNPPSLLYKMKELQHKSSKWLIDCVVKFEITD